MLKSTNTISDTIPASAMLPGRVQVALAQGGKM